LKSDDKGSFRNVVASSVLKILKVRDILQTECEPGFEPALRRKKMTKKVWVVCALMCLVLVACGKSSKYSEAIEVNEEYLTVMEKYVDEIGKVANADEVVKTVEEFAESMEKLIPKMKEIAKKFPELKNETEMPQEFRELEKRAEALGEKMGKSTMSIMKYMQDGKVQESFKKMSMTMMKMGEE